MRGRHRSTVGVGFTNYTISEGASGVSQGTVLELPAQKHQKHRKKSDINLVNMHASMLLSGVRGAHLGLWARHVLQDAGSLECRWASRSD